MLPSAATPVSSAIACPMPSQMTALVVDPVQPARAAGGDRGGLGDVRRQLAGDEVAHHRAVAAPAVVDQRERLGALVHRDRLGDRAVGDRLSIAWPVPSET